MTAEKTDPSTSRIGWILGVIAVIAFVILMVFAISSSDGSSIPDSEVTPAEGESGPDGEG